MFFFWHYCTKGLTYENKRSKETKKPAYNERFLLFISTFISMILSLILPNPYPSDSKY